MSLDNIRKDIEAQFETNWNAGSFGPIDWDGTKELRDAPFVRFEILPGASDNLGFSGCVERTGVVSIMIFVVADKGLGAAWLRANEVVKILENKRLNNTLLYETSIYNRGRLQGSNVHLFEATTFFTSEEKPI